MSTPAWNSIASVAVFREAETVRSRTRLTLPPPKRMADECAENFQDLGKDTMPGGPIDSLVQSYGGRVVWHYDQSIGAFLRLRPNTGICAAVAIEWIRHHANGSSLANVVGGEEAGRTRLRATYEVGRLQGASTRSNNQTRFLEQHLGAYGIVPYRKLRSRTYFSSRANRDVTSGSSVLAGSSGSGGCPNIENDIVHELRMLRDCYVYIGVGGRAIGIIRGGHALSVWIGADGEDTLLFDPNYGEMWFRRQEDFFEFFPGFFRSQYRTTGMRFDNNWDMVPFVKQ